MWREQVPIGGDMENLVDSDNTLIITKSNGSFTVIRYEADKGKSDVWHANLSTKGILFAPGTSATPGNVKISVDSHSKLVMVIDTDTDSKTIPFRQMMNSKKNH